VGCSLGVSADGSGAEMLEFSQCSIVIQLWPGAPVPSSLASRDITRFDAIYQTVLDRHTMSIPALVNSFYERLWNAGDEAAMRELLSAQFSFRGSLGAELKGHAAFWDYVCAVRSALAHYRCDILECVSEGQHAFAKMRFSGIHVGVFRGYRPSGRQVHWEGAALFRFEAAQIRALWVLGDLVGLDALLRSNAESQPVN
jgi:predicted ester cyclase